MSFTTGVENCYFSTSRFFFLLHRQENNFHFGWKKNTLSFCFTHRWGDTHQHTHRAEQWVQPDCWWPPESVHSEVYLQDSVSLLDTSVTTLQVDCTFACLSNAAEFSKPFHSTIRVPCRKLSMRHHSANHWLHLPRCSNTLTWTVWEVVDNRTHLWRDDKCTSNHGFLSNQTVSESSWWFKPTLRNKTKATENRERKMELSRPAWPTQKDTVLKNKSNQWFMALLLLAGMGREEPCKGEERRSFLSLLNWNSWYSQLSLLGGQ